MANNSLGNEIDAHKKLEKLKKQQAEARRKTLIVLSIIFGALLIVAAYVLCLIFLNSARPWIISMSICAIYVGFWNFLRYTTDADFIPWYIVTNIGLTIACIPLYFYAGLARIYAFGFSFAVLLSAIGLLIQCWADKSVTRKKNSYSYRNEYINTYSFKYDGKEYFSSYYFTMIGGILVSISVGLLFSGLARALVIGCSIALTLLTMSVITAVIYCDSDMYVVFGCIHGLAGLVGIVLLCINYNLTVLAICIIGAAFLSGLSLAIIHSEAGFYGTVGGGAFLAGIAVLALLLGHVYTNGDFYVKDGVLVSYSGTEEVVVIPENVTAIGKKAFKNPAAQKNMKEVVIHEGVTSMGKKAFKNCDALESVTIPGSIETVPIKAFYDCDALASVIFNEGTVTIGDYAFYYCSALTSVTFNEGLETISIDAFSTCNKLEQVVLPQSLKYIDSYAFSNCEKLKDVYINSKLDSIGSSAFGKGVKIYYYGSEEEWESISKPRAIKKLEVVYNYKKES